MTSGRDRIRIHAFEPRSRANGPGLRSVIWVQGCTLGCPGCFNPATHTAARGEDLLVDALVERIAALQDEIEGITISGGEPLQQLGATLALIRRMRSRTGLSVLLFTGFSWDEACRISGGPDLLAEADVVLAGRYLAGRRVASGLVGSSNKTVHFVTDRYAAADLAGIPEAEVIIEADGSITLSGIDPVGRPTRG